LVQSGARIRQAGRKDRGAQIFRPAKGVVWVVWLHKISPDPYESENLPPKLKGTKQNLLLKFIFAFWCLVANPQADATIRVKLKMT
jgi:hypothetical protein